jgi:hypothetical protein
MACRGPLGAPGGPTDSKTDLLGRRGTAGSRQDEWVYAIVTPFPIRAKELTPKSQKVLAYWKNARETLFCF